jgi:hypothetical protein
VPVARPRQPHRQLGADAPGVGGQDQDAVGQLDGLLDVVRDDQHRLDREVVALPEPGQLAAQVGRGEHVQRGERLVHQQGVGFDGQRAGEADPLAHAAGQLLGNVPVIDHPALHGCKKILMGTQRQRWPDGEHLVSRRWPRGK